MRMFCTTLVSLFLVAVPAQAVDYAKIDRTLTKEPSYKSKAPKYALLLFGPEAKLRVWVVRDGETTYVDRNGDGDLTGKDKRFDKITEVKDVQIADPDGKTRYVITGMSEFTHPKLAGPYLTVEVEIKGPLQYRQYSGSALAENPQKAAIAHFHGPLTIGPLTVNWKLPPELALVTGDKETDLRAHVGTMSAANGCWVVVRSHNGDNSAFSNGVCPVVDVEFPGKRPGEPPVKKHYSLEKFC